MDFRSELITVINDYWQLMIKWTPKLVLGIMVILIFWFISVQAKRIATKRLAKRMDDPLLARYLSQAVKGIIVITGVAFSLRVMEMGDIAGGLVAGAGVSAFIIGFAFKDIGENFIAGFLMAFNRPFRVGHVIEIGVHLGNVVAMDLRHTQVKTFDGKDIFIPNSFIIKNSLINYTIDGFLRQDFTIGVDYQTDITKATHIILETLKTIPGILGGEKMPTVNVSRLDSSSIALQVFYWLNTFDTSVSGLKVKTEAIQKSLAALDAENIYMPGDVLELKNYASDKVRVTTS